MSDRTVVVQTFSSTIDAEIARDRLEDEGIEAFLRKDDAGGAYPQLQQTQGVHLVTTEEDAPRARDLLEAMQEQTDAPAQVEMDPEQVEKTYTDLSWALLIMGGAIVLLVLLADLGGSSGVLLGLLGALCLLAGGAVKLYRWTRKRNTSTPAKGR